eukprot:1411925-Prymnesium_polylepis.2
MGVRPTLREQGARSSIGSSAAVRVGSLRSSEPFFPLSFARRPRSVRVGARGAAARWRQQRWRGAARAPVFRGGAMGRQAAVAAARAARLRAARGVRRVRGGPDSGALPLQARGGHPRARPGRLRLRAALLVAHPADDVSPRDPLPAHLALCAAHCARFFDGTSEQRVLGGRDRLHLCRHRGGGEPGRAALPSAPALPAQRSHPTQCRGVAAHDGRDDRPELGRPGVVGVEPRAHCGLRSGSALHSVVAREADAQAREAAVRTLPWVGPPQGL